MTRLTVGRVLLEACVTSEADAIMAARAGAGRLELCRDLDRGGLAPGPELVRSVLAAVEIPVRVMVRPESGSFTPSPGEVTEMLRQIERFRESGSEGVVLGVLRSRAVDAQLLVRLVAAAGPMAVTFHRAFDRLADPVGALGVLADAGVSRVLTSGGPPSAREGAAVLRLLVGEAAELRRRVEEAGTSPTILGGGGIRASHAEELIAETGLREVHARASAVPALADLLRYREPALEGEVP